MCMATLVAPQQPVLHSGTAPMWSTVHEPCTEAQIAAIHLLLYMSVSQHVQRQANLNIDCRPALHYSHEQTTPVVQLAIQHVVSAQ